MPLAKCATRKMRVVRETSTSAGSARVGAAGDDRQAGIADERQQRPDDDIQADPGKLAGQRDRSHDQQDRRRAAGHRAGVEFQEFTVETDAARLLGQAVAGLAHSTRHIAVAMRFPAVHNDFVRRV